MLIPLLLCSTQTLAENDFSFAVMPTAFSQQSIYDGGENINGLFPVIELNWKDMFIADGKVGISMMKYKALSLNVSIGVDYMGDTDRGDSKKLEDMSSLDDVFTGNIDLHYKGDLGNLTLGYAQDISGNHEGYNLTAAYGYRFKFGRFFVEPSVAVIYGSDKVADYYYGVSAEDVTVDRALYKIDSTTNHKVSLAAGYVFNENLMVLSFVNATKYDDDIVNSPIVSDDIAMTYGLGIRYQF
jgi:outer membrane protein